MILVHFVSFLRLSAGLQPSVLRELSYSGVRMGLYEPIREMLVSCKGQAGMGVPCGRENGYGYPLISIEGY